MILKSLSVPVGEFEKGTGWAIKPEGACLGEICVPLADAVTHGNVDVEIVATRLGMPLVHHSGVWALGPASLSGHTLPSAVAPELQLPDVNGKMFSLSSLRGQKVLIVSWAPY